MAGQEVSLGQGDPLVLEALQQLPEGLGLAVDIGLIPGGGAVGGTQVGVDPLDAEGGQGKDLPDLLQVAAGLPQAVHSRVHRQVDGQGAAIGRQLAGVGRVHHRLGQAVPPQQGELVRVGVSQDEDLPPDAPLPQLDALRQAGHAEGGHPLPLEDAGHRQGPVAVGVGLHGGHQLAARGQQGPEGRHVVSPGPPG